MAYQCEAYWQEHAVTVHDTFEDAITEAKRLALAYDNCTPLVRGPDVGATVTSDSWKEDE